MINNRSSPAFATTSRRERHFCSLKDSPAGAQTLYIGEGIESIGGFSLPAGYEVHFTTISEFSANVDITLSGTRFDRETQAISYEVEIENAGDYDLLLPMSLVLDPSTATSRPPGVCLARPLCRSPMTAGCSASKPMCPTVFACGQVNRPPPRPCVYLRRTTRLLISFPGFLATASPNLRPGFDTDPVRFTATGASYEYDADATDPDGVAVAYLLHRAPDGMTVDPDTGVVQWSVPNQVAEVHEVVLYAFDSRRRIHFASLDAHRRCGNQAPEFNRRRTKLK